MTFVDMTHDDRVEYFNYHGPLLEQAFADWQAANARFALAIVRCRAHERPNASVESIAYALDEAAARVLAEEVQEYLGV